MMYNKLNLNIPNMVEYIVYIHCFPNNNLIHIHYIFEFQNALKYNDILLMKHKFFLVRECWLFPFDPCPYGRGGCSAG